MKIAIDATRIDMAGGGRFTALNLMLGILQADRDNQYLIFVNRKEDILHRFPNVEQYTIRMRNRFLIRVELQIVLPILLRKKKVDIMHFIKNLGAFLIPCKTVATVYDLSVLAHPNSFPRIDVMYWRTIQAPFLKSVDKIVALSESTKREIAKYYRIPVENIDVIYSACDPIFRRLPLAEIESSRTRYRLPEEYILSVGNISPKKNFDTLVKAMSLLKRDYAIPHKLAIVGKEYWVGGQRPLMELVHRLGLQADVVFLGSVVGHDLVALYNGASLFALPSLDEGFGIVLVEAMASGAPIVASGVTAIPEVVGDAGVLIDDPRDEAELAKAIASVIGDQHRRQLMIARGIERASQFSWQKAGAEYRRIYRQLMS